MALDFLKFNKSRSLDNFNEIAENKKNSEIQLSLRDDTFLKLRDVIYNLCGIYYTDSKKDFIKIRIEKRLFENNILSYEDYLDHLKSPYSREEINKLFEAITINETYFFRAEQQFEAFEKIITPEILKSHKDSQNPHFRIWSAGCSTGEEAYSLAIIILEKLKPLFPNVQFQILASDINNSVLETARAGIFKEYSMRNVPAPFLFKYFTKQSNLYILSEEVKHLVKFANLNLFNKEQMQSVINCDIIFCCNVLLYFDENAKKQVISNFYHSLNKNGYLFVGYSESLHGISKDFKLVHLPKTMAYKKE